MPITKTKHVQSFWKDKQKVTFHKLEYTLKKTFNLVAYIESYASFSVLVLREVRENSRNSILIFLGIETWLGGFTQNTASLSYNPLTSCC